MTEAELHHLCMDWQRWVWQDYWSRTREKLARAPRLQRMLDESTPKGNKPEGQMPKQLLAFEHAVRSMPECNDKTALVIFYCFANLKPIKVVARCLGISRKTFYKGLRRARLHAYRRSLTYIADEIEVDELMETGNAR